MSYHHAQGPLTADARLYLRDRDGNIIARLACTTGKYESEEMNARRLVACWNACQGLTTDDLEKARLVSAVANELMRLEAQRDDLPAQVDQFRALAKANGEALGAALAQRGTLLAALRCAIKKAPELITVPSIRSAIENAEGGR